MKVRRGPRVEKRSFRDMRGALAWVEEQGRDVEREADARPLTIPLVRSFEPVHQVTGRIEVAGPGARAGIDVRGDGSAEAWTGRLRRRVVEQLPGESAYDALRRAL